MYYLYITFFIFSFFCPKEVAEGANVIGDIGYFWHITDIHVDQNYSRNGNPGNLCHNEKLQYPDNGLYGNFLCDSPQYLVNVTFQAMKRIHPNPDFIMWTGDNLPHTISFDPDWNVIYEGLKNISILMTENFPGVPVYPCIGNHDTFPPDMLLPNDSSDSIYMNILKKGGWGKFLTPKAASTFLKGGYFSQVFKPGFRIISLNTILWYSPNKFTSRMTDPANQFSWLENTLRSSSISSEKVYIIGHVPPGFYNRVKKGQKSDPTYHPQYLNQYFKILKKYSQIILGQMFGHLHFDTFQLFSLDLGNFMTSSILASSVTPWHFISPDNISLPVNPSVRLMHYDRQNGLLKDYDQFYLNLTAANNLHKNEVSSNLYELLYTFTKVYNVSDVSTESLIQVYENLKKNSTLFDMFFKYSTAGKESVMCDKFCKVAQLCSIGSTSINEYNSCMGKRTWNSSYSKDHDTSTSASDLLNSHETSILSDSVKSTLAYVFTITVLVLVTNALYIACQICKNRNEHYTKL